MLDSHGTLGLSNKETMGLTKLTTWMKKIPSLMWDRETLAVTSSYIHI